MTQILKNRIAIKYNQISIEDKGKLYISRNLDQGSSFGLYEVRRMLLDKEFDNFVQVSISSENGSIGANCKPSRKGISRLLSIINGTQYRIVNQSGQNFELEGVN